MNNLNDDSDESFTDSKTAKDKQLKKGLPRDPKTDVHLEVVNISENVQIKSGAESEKNAQNERDAINDDFEEAGVHSEPAECLNPNVVNCDNANIANSAKLILQGVTESESSSDYAQQRDVKSSRSHSVCSYLEEDVINQFLDKTTENVGIRRKFSFERAYFICSV